MAGDMMDRVLETTPASRAARVLRALGALALGLLVAPGLLVAANAHAQILTLDEIETKAQRPRPELVEREASIERAEADVRVVEAKASPTLGAKADAQISPGGALVHVKDVEDPDPSSTPYLVSGSREIGQSGALIPQPRFGALLSGHITLLDFGRTSLGIQAAQSALSAERATLLQAKVELVQSARSAYLSWLEAHQTWLLTQRDAEVAHARTVSVKELIDAGARPATDATLSTYDEQLALLHQSRAKSAASAALLALSAAVQSDLAPNAVPDLDVLGPAPDANEAPAASAAPPEPRTPSGQGAPGQAAISTLEQQRQAALSAARASDRAAAPTLDATAEVGIREQTGHVFPLYQGGISLSVPIWDGGLSSADAAVHRAEARALSARLEGAERRLKAEQSAARERYQGAAHDLDLSLQLYATAKLVLSQAEDYYRSGSDTLDRVLNAQRSLVQARREVLTAQLETVRARLELTPVKIQ
jgi:outer membrane protein